MTAPRFVAVAVPIPLRRLFSYRVPDHLGTDLPPGCRVVVPFGKRDVIATVVISPGEAPPDGARVKEIKEVLDRQSMVGPEILKLTRFVSDYYLCSWGDAIEAALPPNPGNRRKVRHVARLPGARPDQLPDRAVAKKRILAELHEGGRPIPVSRLSGNDRKHLPALQQAGLVEITLVETGPVEPPEPVAALPRQELVPTPAQARVLEEIGPALDSDEWAPFLLFGATGSGKTEVYLRAAEQTLGAGKGVIYLVPEIGLTPLLMQRLKGRFGSQVEVLHSGLSRNERFRAWTRVRSGDCRFVVGTRSAVFAPVRNPGLLVVDEEHDPSYKQQETPRYNGRDLAVLRAREAGAVLILGSATPSMESFRHAAAGRYTLLRLGGRVADRPMAAVQVVDMREEYRKKGEVQAMAGPLTAAIEERLSRGEQTLILRNRRGYAVSVFCPGCGNRIQCDHCSITLTWHRRDDKLRCHACDLERRTPERCPHCEQPGLQFLGEGSEKIEDELKIRFPQARIARMDRDAVRRKGAHEELLNRFDAGEIDIMVGTQMIAKGHDFPGVTLVGILSADQSLGLPDFRAGERVFQLLTQVSGRAGRGEKPGEVVLQAFDPDHPVLLEAIRQDYESFYNREVEYRRSLRYPPFTSMIQLLVSDRNPGKAAIWADQLAEAVRREGQGRLMVNGPGLAPVERLRGKYRQQILVRSAGRRKMVDAVGRALEQVDPGVPRRAVAVDVDPYSLI